MPASSSECSEGFGMLGHPYQARGMSMRTCFPLGVPEEVSSAKDTETGLWEKVAP